MAFDFPAAPANGQEFTPAGGPTYVYSAPVWLLKGAAVVPPPTEDHYVGDVPPAAPVAKDIWFESDTGKTFFYYDDGTSVQWVEIGSGGGTSAPPFRMTQTTLLTSGTYNKPADLKYLEVITVGAGGGSPAASNSAAGTAKGSGGGGGAGTCISFFDAANLPASCAYTVGIGTAGLAGGVTTFDAGAAGLMSAGGGTQGLVTSTANYYAAGGAAGAPTGGNILNTAGATGGNGVNGVDGITDRAMGGEGGGSVFGPTIPSNRTETHIAALQGRIPGGGSRGGATANAWGAVVAEKGADGCIILKEYF